ncbi:MAG: hypothetical protein ACKO9T_02835, partial [Nitrospira sp.]
GGEGRWTRSVVVAGSRQKTRRSKRQARRQIERSRKGTARSMIASTPLTGLLAEASVHVAA